MKRAISEFYVTYNKIKCPHKMTHEGSTITKAEALAAFEELLKGIIRLLSQGNSIVTPLVNISPRVTGLFTSADYNFDCNRHQLMLRLNIGLRLKDTEKEIPVEKVAPRERQPVPINFHDNTSETQNEIPPFRTGYVSL